MQRIDAIRAIAPMITPDDLLTTSIGGPWDDWWNHKAAHNTFFTGHSWVQTLGWHPSQWRHRFDVAHAVDDHGLFGLESPLQSSR